MTGIDTLRSWFPWPAERPEAPQASRGWFRRENQERLRQVLGPHTKVVYEVGSYHGLSSSFLAEVAPNAVIICNDHWLGSLEHYLSPEWREDLPRLYETFLFNLWPRRDRVIPLRATIQDGMEIVHHLGIAPEVVYIDGSHDTQSVRDDVAKAVRLFPGAEIIGDDADRESVVVGVRMAIAASPDLGLAVRGPCWWIPRIRRGPSSPPVAAGQSPSVSAKAAGPKR